MKKKRSKDKKTKMQNEDIKDLNEKISQKEKTFEGLNKEHDEESSHLILQHYDL